MSTTAAAEGYSSEEDSRGGLLHDPFGIVSSANPAKRIKVDLVPAKKKSQVDAAPHVLAEDIMNQTSLIARPSDTQMLVNIPYNDLTLPLAGPQNPLNPNVQVHYNQNTLAGHVEELVMDDTSFKTQHLTHQTLGYAANPSEHTTGEFIGDIAKAFANDGRTVNLVRSTKGERKDLKRKRKEKGDLGLVEGEGAYQGPWAKWQGDEDPMPVPEGYVAEPSPEPEAEASAAAAVAARKQKTRAGLGTESSIFHGKSEQDYQGRTYMYPPYGVAPQLNQEAGSQESFIPKVCIHTWTGHTGGIASIRLFPGTSHLLLSASMDTKIKLWDVYNEGNCLRTFLGHTRALKDIAFSPNGTRFLSTGHDRQIKLWDTETGKCIRSFSNGKMAHVVKWFPEDEKGGDGVFLAGMGDKKIIQYDIASGEITQEYDQHLGAINTITFVDENRRFVTTSDDKTIRAWDWDIPVVIKYIAEPHMHSMPAVTLHPSKKYFAAQSLDNQILIYNADNFRQNRKKRFAGHSVAGYACQVGFSPDGRWLSSGDGHGDMVFWDWKTGRIKSRLKCHSKVVIAHEWLEHETSKVVTASWDGLIKLWD